MPTTRSCGRSTPSTRTSAHLTLLDAASRPLGLSAGLAGLFALTFAVTCLGLDRLARAIWPEEGTGVGLVAVGLVLMAKAGNIGTNHLFEAMLLDRLIGFALGWLALAGCRRAARARPRRWRPWRSGWRPWSTPRSACNWGCSWVPPGSPGALWPGASAVGWRRLGMGLALLGLALAPGLALTLGQGDRLFRGLPPEEFRLLSVEIQGPQHLLPHLWRLPQWLAWGCYPVLACLALGRVGQGGERRPWPAARVRLALMMAVNLVGLGIAWWGVEVARDLRLTLFQPFRMATMARGLALARALRPRHRPLEARPAARPLPRHAAGRGADGRLGPGGRHRLRRLAGGDGSRAVATGRRTAVGPEWRCRETPEPEFALEVIVGGVVLGCGLVFLARHDTESGHLPILGALAVLAVWTRFARGRSLAWEWTPRRLAWAGASAWAIPLAALAAAVVPGTASRIGESLVARCRFAAVPIDDMERLAVWCRDHTPPSARFIGPPGPKTFRLWSLRSLAFNRAASPYHAEGLADWSARFRDHVGFDGASSDFVRAYQEDRHGLERRYDAMSDAERAALAVRQGATHVVGPPTREPRRMARWSCCTSRGDTPSTGSGRRSRPLADRRSRAGSNPPSRIGPVPGSTSAVGHRECLSRVGRDRIIAGELADLAADTLGERRVVGLGQDLHDPGGDLAHGVLAEAAGGQGGGPHADAAGVERLAGVEGDQVLVDGDPGAAEGGLGDLAGQALRASCRSGSGGCRSPRRRAGSRRGSAPRPGPARWR